jgi:predicted DNA-binding protein (MmcQ/YjbR family)
MHIDEIRVFCISKKGVTEHFPFDDMTLVFKVKNKMFALLGLDSWERGDQKINLKCHPDWSEELRGEYEGINAGYHMNKKFWNTVTINSADVSDEFAKKLINHSYDEVVKGLSKRVQKELNEM